MPQFLDVLRGCADSQHDPSGVARNKVDDEENENREPQQHRKKMQQTAEYVSSHGLKLFCGIYR
jgi:hypothetical protein